MQKNLTFYFLRHGRTEWNEKGLLQGQGNSALTAAGVAGALAAGKALEQVPFVAAYSSCLQRTIDTARYVIGTRPIPLFQHQGLNEQFFGKWEGIQIDEIRASQAFQNLVKYPKAYDQNIEQYNQGEPFAKLAERSYKAIQDIIQVHQQGNILIVSHGHTLRLLLSLLGGHRWQDHRKEGVSVSLANCSISIFDYQQSAQQQSFQLVQMNGTDHLPQV
ncbi:phosphoglycerate mutase [Gallibacterium anatis]|uniref:histidine phosphatase family protein n=1 Tax=Gallibacterium anatis TaxID=750 RepID=UPI0005321857|nr:histidine phosphatase family protein [Gallibacterium anatis]KGQ45152.1 phosphoglycerate mutase [Gallibacterium anatis]KGQ53705.1 phosphoglycerate mutase [Gallibacterium anatis]KGQ60743.1 phosphoglycerate mutase [Gallibacterium anatis]